MRDKKTAALLALFLGGFGIHRFYLGQTFLGILYMLFFWTALPFILNVVDSVLLILMPDEVFDAKYNRDSQVAKRNGQRYRKSNKRNRRNNDPRIKQRHQVNGNINNRRPKNAKHQVLFRKYWDMGRKAFKDYQFEDAESAYSDALSINPNKAELLFDMACLYSMTEQQEKGFEYIELAIHNGFSDFDRIDNEPSLAYLRIQDDFLNFAKAGYKRKPRALKKHSPELLEQLRQLDKLKTRGLLTELEFESERKKILH